MIGAKYDSMNPLEMKEMSTLVQNGEYLYCPIGSHLALWDDQEVFMDGVIVIHSTLRHLFLPSAVFFEGFIRILQLFDFSLLKQSNNSRYKSVFPPT